MADPLKPVLIQELRPLAQGREWWLDQHLPSLESLTPVRGRLRALHRGQLLELDGEASTIVTLCCDRCLQPFNHPLAFRTHELLRLGEEAGNAGLEDLHELQLQPDEFTETVDPAGSFDPAHWVYEQLSLQLPLVNRCGSDCPGPGTWSSESELGDPRWAALKALKP
ncbi:MAG: DUF177 domain-containing protein [Cyanobacteriota bacterium]|jgi:uncharacterized protein|nr:DUF177 domain-containing protein [Cyanobacteriota bacterium]